MHVSRTLQALTAQGLIEIECRVLRITDFDALMEVGLFMANYLHLDHEGWRIDSNEFLRRSLSFAMATPARNGAAIPGCNRGHLHRLPS